MDKRQVSRIKALLSAAGARMIPAWIELAALRHDPHLQLGVAKAREYSLGDLPDLGES